LEKELHEIKMELVELRAQVEQDTRLLETMYIRLFGNGKEGIIETVNRHKTYFTILSASTGIIIGCLIKMFI